MSFRSRPAFTTFDLKYTNTKLFEPSGCITHQTLILSAFLMLGHVHLVRSLYEIFGSNND